MPRDFATARAIQNAQGYEFITTARKAITKIEDELAGDRNATIIGAQVEIIAGALSLLPALVTPVVDATTDCDHHWRYFKDTVNKVDGYECLKCSAEKSEGYVD